MPAHNRHMLASNDSSPEFRALNVAAYKFVALYDLPNRRSEPLDLCTRLELRGTILLSEKGINLLIAGVSGSAHALLRHLRSEPALEDLVAKESWSEAQPFGRMRVKIRREIIAFGVEGIEPATSISWMAAYWPTSNSAVASTSMASASSLMSAAPLTANSPRRSNLRNAHRLDSESVLATG